MKADNHILYNVLRANRMIVWIVRNFISREANVLEINKILKQPHEEYCT